MCVLCVLICVAKLLGMCGGVVVVLSCFVDLCCVELFVFMLCFPCADLCC